MHSAGYIHSDWGGFDLQAGKSFLSVPGLEAVLRCPIGLYWQHA